MRSGLRAIVLLAAILIAPPLFAQTAPPDSNIKGSLYDIGRAEKQLKSLTPSRKANIKRLQRSMQITGKRLKASPNKTHPTWIQAKQRLDRVNSALAALAGGGSASPAAPAKSGNPPAATTQAAPRVTQPTGAAADPVVARAQREMKRVEAQVRNLRPSDSRGAMRQLKELFRIGGALAKTKDRSHPTFKQAAQQYNRIKGTLVGAMLKIEQKQLSKVAGRLDKMRPLDYANKSKVKSGRQALAGIKNSLIALRAPKASAVRNLYGRVAKVSEIFEKRIAKNSAHQASLGDVSAKLAALRKRNDTIRVPSRIVHPATEATVRSFIASVAAVKAHIKEDLAYIQSIDGKAALSTNDGNIFRRLRSVLQAEKPRSLQRILDTVNAEMDLNVNQALDAADFYDKTDPKDVNHRNNRLTGKGQYEKGLKRLAAARETVRLAALYDKEIGRPNPPDRNPQMGKITAATEGFKEKFTVALNTVRMPKARSTDRKLHKAVAEVFAKPKYGYKYERTVINSPLKRLNKKTGDIRGNVSSATITVYEFEWDQFQAITAEKVGDSYYLYANTFTYYYKGGPRTPIKVWILSNRFQSSQILKENIGK